MPIWSSTPTRVSDRTVAALRHALEEQTVINRYLSHISSQQTRHGCRLWTGAVSSRGHGRFWIGSYTINQPNGTSKQRDIVVIAHRYGWALTYGLASLLKTEQVTHLCDEPLCQTPEHWVAGTNSSNQADYHTRRRLIGSPLRDVRGSAGRAADLRHAARTNGDLDAAHRAGQPTADQLQPMLPGTEWVAPVVAEQGEARSGSASSSTAAARTVDQL